MKLPLLRRRSAGLLVALLAGSAPVVSCHEGLDTSRNEGPDATLGDDIYGVLCDRMGADVLQEDLTGASYQAVCHYDAKGKYADEVDESVLPVPTGERAKEARRLSLAKMRVMARRRSDLVRALNATLPDIDIDNPATADTGDKVRLHDAMFAMGQSIVPLYELDPFDPFAAEALAPAATRSLGRLFDTMGQREDAMEMFAQMWGRRGYRPTEAGLGVMRSALAYPELRDFTIAGLGVLGPLGDASKELQEMLRIGETELEFATIETSKEPDLTFDAPFAQLNRPRTTIELTRDLLLSQNPSFAESTSTPERYISLRDRRGFVVPFGNVPGGAGTVGAPFVDVNGDGYADIDLSGRFLSSSGEPLSVATPFAIPGETDVPTDAFGRPENGTLYEYVDTSRTVSAALTRQLIPLLDATRVADEGDPRAFEQESETLMYTLAGAYLLLGGRENAEYDFETDTVVPVGTNCKSCLNYSRFRAEDSAIPDLAHALGQVLADEDSDAMLLGMIDLFENHEPEMARLIGAALRVKEVANEHDIAAANGEVPAAELAYEVPVWDETAVILSAMTEEPGLIAELLAGLADPAVVTPEPGSLHLGEAVARFASTRDHLTYDPTSINGPAVNLTVGSTSLSDPVTPVDWKGARTGENRSLLQRSLQLIRDAMGSTTCNKEGAVVKAVALGISVDWPLVGDPYHECELFEVNDLAAFYLDSILDINHPKRSMLTLKSDALNSIMDILPGTPDDMFQESSELTGLTTRPTPAALNRLVFFGASSDRWGMLPDFDAMNNGSRTEEFVSAFMEPSSTLVCPVGPNGTGICQTKEDLLRLRDAGTIFAWERLGFYNYLRPVVTKFANLSCNASVTFCERTDLRGENMFAGIVDILHRHWAGEEHGSECVKQGDAASNPRYCSEAGMYRYEPIIDKSLRTDIIPALHEFAKAAKDVSQITIARGPRAGETMSGTEVLELTTKILFSKKYAAAKGLVDRQGNKSTTWTDGTPQDQLTVFNLFTDAFHKMDVAWEAGGEDGALRKAMWKRGRSQLVDAFLAVEGDGPNARFKSATTVPILLTTLKLMREQLNAHCPTRETNGQCTWAKRDLGKKLSDVMSGPSFAAMMDMLESIRKDDKARRSTERFVAYLLESANNDGQVLQGTLASMVDMMQIMADDAKLVPIMRAAASVASPKDAPKGAGCADRTIGVLKALTTDKYDRYHVMDHVLAALVTPMESANGVGLSPLEVFADVFVEVNRLNSDDTGPLDPEDYTAVMGVLRDFMVDESRGLEQLYEIINNRKRI